MTASFGRLLNIYENIVASSSDRSTTATLLRDQVWTERTIFTCWGRAVGISGNSRARAKALSDSDVVLAVTLTICRVTDVFADAGDALRVYGVQIDDTGQKTLLQRVLSGLCGATAGGKSEGAAAAEWHVRDGSKFGDLVEELKKVNCDLHRIIPRGSDGCLDAERAGVGAGGSDMGKATTTTTIVGFQGVAFETPSLPPPAYSPGSGPPAFQSTARLAKRSLDPILDFLLGEHLRATLGASAEGGCLPPSAPEMATNLEDLIWQAYFSSSPICRAVHESQTTLGRDHPETIQSLHSLARTLSDRHLWAWALPLYLLCMSREKRTLGEAHPDTLRSMSGLAFAFQNTGRDHDAMEMYEKALAGWGAAVNIYTVRARINMASIYADNELFADAEGVLAETVDDAVDALGHRHETTRLAKHNLAFLLRTLGRFEEAKEVYECGGREHKWVDCPLQGGGGGRA